MAPNTLITANVPPNRLVTPNVPTSKPKAKSGTIVLYPSRGTSVILLVDGPTARSGGVGGWQTTVRTGLAPVRWFDAPTVDVLPIAAILDLYEPEGVPLETRLARLYSMGMRGTDSQPPTIQVRGDIRPGDAARTWVMQDITLGDCFYAEAGVLAQVHLTVALEGFTAAPLIEKASVKRTRANGASAPRTRKIRTVKGDTLRSIAVKQLGTSAQYADVRTWNPSLAKVDPDQPLRAGILIVLH